MGGPVSLPFVRHLAPSPHPARVPRRRWRCGAGGHSLGNAGPESPMCRQRCQAEAEPGSARRELSPARRARGRASKRGDAPGGEPGRPRPGLAPRDRRARPRRHDLRRHAGAPEVARLSPRPPLRSLPDACPVRHPRAGDRDDRGRRRPDRRQHGRRLHAVLLRPRRQRLAPPDHLHLPRHRDDLSGRGRRDADRALGRDLGS